MQAENIGGGNAGKMQAKNIVSTRQKHNEQE